MYNFIRNRIITNKDVVWVYASMVAIFAYAMFVIKWATDFPAHAYAAQMMLEEGKLFSGNFLMYFLLNLFTLFTGAKYPLRAILVLLIAAANTAKYVLVRNAFREHLSPKYSAWASVSLLLVYIIPIIYLANLVGISFGDEPGNMYLGYYVPNVWHNSTYLCMMPFAIATYLLSVKQFHEYLNERNWQIAIVLAISVLIKPSFFFIYILAYPCVMCLQYRFTKRFWESLWPICVGMAILAYEYISIYMYGAVDIYESAENSKVVIDILSVLSPSFWSADRVIYILISLSFPLLFLLMEYRRVIHDKELWFVAIMLFSAIGISLCCKETGPRANHGNFGWQVIAAMWFVYYYILRVVTKTSEGERQLRYGIRMKLISYIYCAHVIFGVIYVVRFIVTQNYF